MSENWDDFLSKIFSSREYDGENKIVALEDCVTRHVQKGMTLYIGERANALISQLIRDYYESEPQFNVIMLILMEQALSLIHCGMVKKITTSSCTEITPTPGPSFLVQKAFKDKTIEIENWSLCSLNQRLLAGAFDLPFIPTKSIGSSSMASDNRETFCTIEDPFENEKTVGLAKALKPDIALIHGWAADPAGNTIVAPAVIGGDCGYGAKASKNGVIVSVEKIVSTDFIRKHAALVQIPSAIVRSVSLAPLGAHPQGMVTNYGIEELEPYLDDYEFSLQRRRASKDSRSYDRWLNDWVLNICGHQEYLQKLDDAKIRPDRIRGANRTWSNNLNPKAISSQNDYSPREMMIIAAARKTKKLILSNNYDGVLCGIGLSGLTAWIAYYELKKLSHNINLWLGSGVYGFSPCPGDPNLFSLPTIMSAKMLTSSLEAYGIFVGGNYKDKYMSVLSAAQVDQHGNLNSTKLSETSYLIGSGGSNDSCNANQLLVVIPQSVERFVPQVSYVTCPGNITNVIVSDMGVYERINGDFFLTSYFANAEFSDPHEIVKEIGKRCGWNFKIQAQLSRERPPSMEELVMLRALDPKGYFTGKEK